MLNDLARLLGDVVAVDWQDGVMVWGQGVALWRQYNAGEHRAKLTAAMRDMLRISGTVTDQFNDNYCEMVVDRMADRLVVESIVADSDAGSQWSAGVMAANRFDGLQMDVHADAVCDGDAFVMVSWDNEAQQVRLTHESAWDGRVGVIPVYDRMARQLVAAVKVWDEGNDKRVNVYLPDRIEKLLYRQGAAVGVGGEFVTLGEAEWVDNAGRALGVPLFHLRNKRRTGRFYGRSEIANVVPLQDALNRTLVSMVLTSELTAFQVRVARGFDPPANLSPGMWVVIGPDGLSNEQVADASVMEQGQIVPFISQADWIINQIGTISRTPLPSMMGGDSQSGEALKERENGLLEKVQVFSVRNGNVWEDVMAFAHRLAGVFGSVLPPVATRWTCRWRQAEIRNRTEIIDNALKVRESVGEKEFLRLIAPAYGYDPDKIAALMAEVAAQQAERLAALAGNLPGFSEFNMGGA